MAMTLHAHPFSAHCHKVLVALEENATPSCLHAVDLGDAQRD